MEDKCDAVLMRAKVFLADWTASQQVAVKEIRQFSDQQQVVSWNKPPIGVLKCNRDSLGLFIAAATGFDSAYISYGR